MADPQSSRRPPSLHWRCGQCHRSCLPIREECRCLCGHRLKVHGRSPIANNRCTAPACGCQSFFYIVGEGSWILRCRCKHRHTDHDPGNLACRKPSCGCTSFTSPWVCNCDHAWDDHTQVWSHDGVVGCAVAPEVNRWDLVQRGVKIAESNE